MNKILIKIGLLILIIVLTSCSYSPIFSEKNYNFEIDDVTLIGEKEINKLINNKLNLIQNNQNTEKKKFNLEIFSTKNRNVISKNSKGDPLKFEMVIFVKYKIIHNETLLLEKEIEKNNIYNNDSDQFKLEQSEKIIIENISGNISDTIISSIINLNDN
tara:strand:+ start:1241 stop:1717 length:477 start_codon:yes stop_codon:yes gene_type:complete